MKFSLKVRTEQDTKKILNWCYEGIYSFYDNNIQQEKIDNIISLTGSDRAFSVVNEEGELVGNCEFYDVSDNEEEEILAVGIQMEPSLTGRGYGTEFSRAIIEEGRERLKYDYLELSVADFNTRARKVYEKIGFKKIDEIYNEIRGNKYKFIIMAKKFKDN
ncbi:GNAT family N-acetyltransferase [Clostridium amazonitimonense]|uniref:GNAT family N-acetyltransferase n=1 Tax=Clostridium amazonitimonense TaxID=1499689 RepID=UPI0005095A98|nr:GNAT family N-acetyltransferase [Clostridium amazonitimonense]